jgi:ligand-binding sensor domain-containing protein
MRYTRETVIHLLALFVDLLTFLVGLALLCAPVFALNPNRHVSQYAHTAWRMQEGFFNGRANIIAQTTDGYLWFGTGTGLLRFDGVRFIPWVPADGEMLPHSSIHNLLGSRDGSLWIGTRDGLFRLKDEKIMHVSDVPGPIAEIVEDREGVIWVARGGANDTAGPICRVDGAKSRCLNEADGIPAGVSGSESLTKDEAGNLWIGTKNLLLRWKEGSPAVYKPVGLESNGSVGIDALAASPDGSMLVGMAKPGRGLGLEHLIDGAWKPFLAEQLDGSTLSVTELFLDRDGALWIGTVDQGIYHYYHGRVDQFRRSDGLSSDFISRIFQDKEGTLWVVTPEGVDSFHDLNVVTWSAREGLTTDNVVSVAAAHDGTVWVGNAGGLDAIRQGNVSSIREGKGLPGNQVRSIFEDQENRLWVGVDNNLTVLQNGRFRKISRMDGTSIGPVDGIAEDLQNNLWVDSSWDKELLRIRDFKVVEEFRPPGISSEHVLTADAQGNLWLGLTTGDLARFRDGHTEVIHFPPAMGSRVRQVVANPDGYVLAATTSGVLVWRDGRALTLGTRNGLPCEGVNGLVWDARRNLWMYTACGLVEIEQPELQRWWMQPESTVHFRYFDVLDGVQPGNAFYEPAAKSKDGRLWFANGRLLQVIDPASLTRNSIPPPVHVEEIVANRRHYSTDGLVRLPRLTRDLEIDYTALSFVTPQKVHFRYRLDGYDKDWQDSGTRRQAFYTDLPPGDYQFRVIASNSDGVWNETGATASFFIVPAFYQTSWFRILCAIAAVSTLYMIYLIHLRQVTHHIQEQLATRLEERERIARELHDTLLQGFQGLMLRFQSVLKNIPAEAPARQMMESALDRADEVLLEGRQRVHNLREEGTTGNGPWENLARWGNELAQGSSTRFSAAILGTPQPLDPTVCDEIYQIGREALNNAFRHAFANEIEMEITYDRRKVTLVVRDDGAGMDNEILKRGRSGHWGMSGMRERSQKIGAQLNIWSHGGAGTEIDLSIPAKVAYRHLHQRSGWNGFKRRVAKQSE